MTGLRVLNKILLGPSRSHGTLRTIYTTILRSVPCFASLLGIDMEQGAMKLHQSAGSAFQLVYRLAKRPEQNPCLLGVDMERYYGVQVLRYN
jgi:hypothetical protein